MARNQVQYADHVFARRIYRLEKELNETFYSSAHGYYAAKDELREAKAERVGKSACEFDPMGFWFGMQSN